MAIKLEKDNVSILKKNLVQNSQIFVWDVIGEQ